MNSDLFLDRRATRFRTFPRRDRRGRRPAIESIEPRTMLSGAGGTFAVISSPADPATGATIDLRRADFDRPSGGDVLVTITCQAADGIGSAGPISVAPASSGGSVRILSAHVEGTQAVCVAALSPGRFRVSDSMTSASQFAFRLAGDVNGDFQVGRRDIGKLRALIDRGSIPASGAAFDVNGDGKLSRADLRLALKNRGAGTSVRTLVAAPKLDASSDPNGDGVVATPDVTVRGAATAGSTVQLVGAGGGAVSQAVPVGKDGTFVATTSVPMGRSTVYAIVTDRFGQVASVGVPVQRRDVTIDWSNALLDAVRDTKGNPPASARQMAILGVSMYDAVDSIDRTYQPYYQFVATPTGTSREAAAASAAHEALFSLYPARAAVFDALLASSLADLPDGAPKSDGVALGKSVADGILALRAGDGSGNTVTAPTGTKPGEWRPTPPAFLPPLLPGWGDVKPFAVTSATQFRIPAPPALDSPEYAAAVQEVQQIGSATSTTRTAQETDTARFWADAGGTWTPPGHWFHIAGDVAAQHNNTISQNARMFALVGMALADSAVTVWNDKYDYYFWRPVTAIRLADTDGNPATTADPNWLSLIPTPNFPSDSSGHSTFSAAAAGVLASLFGTDNVTFTTAAEGFNVAPRTFTSFSQAAFEAGRSRVLGGIHFTFENLAGRQVGTALGQYVAANLLKPLSKA